MLIEHLRSLNPGYATEYFIHSAAIIVNSSPEILIRGHILLMPQLEIVAVFLSLLVCVCVCVCAGVCDKDKCTQYWVK